MALPSRLGAFMVGTAVGAAQCFYWLHEDVHAVQAALSRKIDAVSADLRRKESDAAARLTAMHDAVPQLASAAAGGGGGGGSTPGETSSAAPAST